MNLLFYKPHPSSPIPHKTLGFSVKNLKIITISTIFNFGLITGFFHNEILFYFKSLEQ